jgi:hypothetical protein
MKGQNQIASQTTHWRLTMRTTKKTVAAAALAAGVMMTGTVYAQQVDVRGPKGMKSSDATLQMRGDRNARAQVRAQNRALNQRGWRGHHAGWSHPFGWPGAAAGAGFAAGTVIGGAANTAGAIVGAPFGAYAYDRSGFYANAQLPHGYPEYDSGGNAIFFTGPNDMPCSLNLKQLNRC